MSEFFTIFDIRNKWESGYNREPKTFEHDNKELLTN